MNLEDKYWFATKQFFLRNSTIFLNMSPIHKWYGELEKEGNQFFLCKMPFIHTDKSRRWNVHIGIVILNRGIVRKNMHFKDPLMKFCDTVFNTIKYSFASSTNWKTINTTLKELIYSIWKNNAIIIKKL